MNVKFSSAQSDWLQLVTGEKTLQEAVNFFLDCMEQEKIPRNQILIVIDKMMKRKKLPPGKK